MSVSANGFHPPVNGEDSERYQLLVDHSPDLILRCSTDGRILYASSALNALTGYAPADWLARPLFDFIHPLDVEKVRDAFVSLRVRTATRTLDYRLRCQDGHWIWVGTTCKAVRDFASTITQEVLAYSRDVTEEKQIEAALQVLARGNDSLSNQEFFRLLVSHVTAALHVSFAFVTETNPEHTQVRMLAFWKGTDFATPYEYPLDDTPCDGVINQGKVCHYPIGVQSIFPKDQDLVALNAQGYIGLPIYDSMGRVIGHLAVLDDKPMKLEDPKVWILKIFAYRAGIELERMQRVAIS